MSVSLQNPPPCATMPNKQAPKSNIDPATRALWVNILRALKMATAAIEGYLGTQK